LVDLGVTRLVMPRRWGGLELGFAAVVDVVRALAQACMSAAWCAALYAEHPWVLARFEEQAQADVWSGGPDVPLSMSVAASGRATRVDGGHELSGSWPFVSGCDQAPWFLLLASWGAADGSGARSGLCLVPRSDVSIDHASWQVAGLRGTGSKTLSVDRAFVPSHRVRDAELLAAGPDAPGASPLFCQPLGGTLGLVLAAVAVGGAEGALVHFRHRLTQRVLRFHDRVQAFDPAAQIDLAEATLKTESARLLLEDACEVVRAAGEQAAALSVLEVAELRARKAHVVRECAQAVDRLFAASGGGALQEANPLQRFWRDVHAIQAHAGMNWSAHAQNYGSLALGLGPTVRRPW
jgi:3-hydroxy-9,10-secoandrosta-1,3,5(10)-triene-9,17-dione monooxygenase